MPMDMNEGLGQLAQAPGPGPEPTGPGMAGPAPSGPTAAPPGPGASGGQHGGPGIDTPIEQKAMTYLAKGAELIREAANVDPSIRPIIDQHLERAFLDVMTAYGMGEQAKLSLKQAKMQRDQQRSSSLGGPPVAPISAPGGQGQAGPSGPAG